MGNLKKLKIPVFFLLAFTLFLLPSVSALEVNDTTFFSSVSNYTIYVDSITISEVNVTNLTISFYNLTSSGSNFTNINATYDARADFYELGINLTIRNVNTSTDLFTSSSGDQDYNATFTSGQTITITGTIPTPTETESDCSTLTRTILRLIPGFLAISILLIALSMIYIRYEDGELSSDINVGKVIVVFITIMIGVVVLKAISENIISACG